MSKILSLSALRTFAGASKPLSSAQYADATATVHATTLSGRAVLALVAYGVSTRGIAGADKGTESMTRLAADTLPTPEHSPNGWRSTLSKYAGACRYAATAGVLPIITPEGIDLLIRGYDSTADGRKILGDAASKAGDLDDNADALAALMTAATAAVATKSAARKAGDDKRAARPDDGSKASTASESTASESNGVQVKATWLQVLAGVADAAAAETAALDSSALAKATALHAAIGDALADATATMTAAVATARAARKGAASGK